MTYLNLTGITKLFSLIKNYFLLKSDYPFEKDENGDLMLKEGDD